MNRLVFAHDTGQGNSRAIHVVLISIVSPVSQSGIHSFSRPLDTVYVTNPLTSVKFASDR